jgi:hypothetical protein
LTRTSPAVKLCVNDNKYYPSEKRSDVPRWAWRFKQERPIISSPGDRAFLLSQTMRCKRDCLRAPSVTHKLRCIYLAVPTFRPHDHWPTVAISRSFALDCTSASLVPHIAVAHALIRAPAGPPYYLSAVVLLLILPHVINYTHSGVRAALDARCVGCWSIFGPEEHDQWAPQVWRIRPRSALGLTRSMALAR